MQDNAVYVLSMSCIVLECFNLNMYMYSRLDQKLNRCFKNGEICIGKYIKVYLPTLIIIHERSEVNTVFLLPKPSHIHSLYLEYI